MFEQAPRRRFRGATTGRIGAAIAVSCLSAASVSADPPYGARGGGNLPFATEAEAITFLETAEVVEIEEMEAGTNKKKRRVTLAEGGTSVRAIHRNTFDYRDMATVGFVDSYLSELAAYELSRMLGLAHVPATTRRKVQKSGAIQLWIEGATTEADRLRQKIEPADPEWFAQQIDMLRLFDNLIANTDRNPGNILIGPDGRVWYIDHTRSFAGYDELRDPDRLVRCERGVWERLRSIPDGELRSRLEPYAAKYLDELTLRRRLVVEHLQARIDELGEAAVIFDWKQADGGAS
jgi:hypothetical protein